MARKTSRWERFRDTALGLWDESLFRSGDDPSRLYRFIHFWVLVGKSFVRNRCPIRASSLSYTTLLALIPMLAVALSVTSSLLKDEGEERIAQFIDHFVSSVVPPASLATNTTRTFSKPITPLPSPVETNVPALTGTNTPAPGETGPWIAPALPEPSTNAVASGVGETVETTPVPAPAEDLRIVNAQRTVAREIYHFIQKTRSATLGVTGMILLIFVAIRMLSSIEATFNDIWGVVRGRNWFLRIIIYWAVLTLGPLLLAGALGLTGGPHIQATRQLIGDMPLVGRYVFPSLTLGMLWMAFAVFYKTVPNTKVNFSAALVGGFVAGSLWHLNNVFGFLFVSRVFTNSKIYGSLGLVPVFMAGLYLSWLMLLFGAQVAYAFQNRQLYLQEKLAENVNQRGREFVALRLMTCVGQRFQRGDRPPSVQEMSIELGIPSRLVQQVLQTLVAAHLVIEISGAEPAYTPARPLEDITAHHLLQAMRATQGQELITRDEPVRAEVYGEFARIQEAEKQAASSLSMLTLVHRAQARLELAPPPAEAEEMKLSPALKPASVAPAPVPVQPIETVFIPEPAAPVATAESFPSELPAAPKPSPAPAPSPAALPRPIAEPLSDAERNFPL